MKVDVLLGLQWGDEGKGKIVDILTPKYDVIARFQGGPNAGHTIEFNNNKYILHTIPSGIFHDSKINIIGNGVVIDPVIFENEITKLRLYGAPVEKNIYIAKKTHLILPSHRLLDAASEYYKGKSKIGSTLKGIGPTYTDKISRCGIRIGDIKNPDFYDIYAKLKLYHLTMIKNFYDFDYSEYLIDKFHFEEYEKKWFSSIDNIKKFNLIDCEYYVNSCLENNKTILAEGAQGSMLDIDFGTYPFVTSSNTTCAGACTGLGISPHKIGDVIGIFKAYCTRVGSGPFPTELLDETGDYLREKGNEFGSTTGRPRRCGWLDLPALKYAIMLNGVTKLVMMKSDVLNDLESIKVCTHYRIGGQLTEILPFDMSREEFKPQYIELKGWKSDLKGINRKSEMPVPLKDYISFLEKELKIPIDFISTGPDRTQTITG
jgi:adenylosuccinate synthase